MPSGEPLIKTGNFLAVEAGRIDVGGVGPLEIRIPNKINKLLLRP